MLAIGEQVYCTLPKAMAENFMKELLCSLCYKLEIWRPDPLKSGGWKLFKKVFFSLVSLLDRLKRRHQET